MDNQVNHLVYALVGKMKQEYYLTHVQEETNAKVVESRLPRSLMFLVKNKHQ
jgi:hypothetical protein